MSTLANFLIMSFYILVSDRFTVNLFKEDFEIIQKVILLNYLKELTDDFSMTSANF
jgi:hypothetical protein